MNTLKVNITTRLSLDHQFFDRQTDESLKKMLGEVKIITIKAIFLSSCWIFPP